jgi:uncharacterized membrane protein
MGLAVMVAGILLFVGGHAFVTMRKVRAGVIARWGEGPYKIAFSLIAALGIVLMAYGFARYRATGWIDVWYPPAWTRHVAVALMLPAVILLFAAYLPGRIKATLKHPMLAAVKLWAVAHLIANGDLGSIILFGSLLAWAVFDRIMVKQREAAGELARGPVTGPGRPRNDAIAVGLGVLAYFALGFFFHPLVIGIPVFSG